jgi:hypothetical protein
VSVKDTKRLARELPNTFQITQIETYSHEVSLVNKNLTDYSSISDSSDNMLENDDANAATSQKRKISKSKSSKRKKNHIGRSNEKSEKIFGQTNEPLTTCFQFYEVVPDIMHMFLRITDTLIALLLKKIKIFDISNQGFNYFNVFTDFIEKRCRIRTPTYLKDNEHILRDFNGEEKERLFCSIEISSLLPKINRSEQISNIWSMALIRSI